MKLSGKLGYAVATLMLIGLNGCGGSSDTNGTLTLAVTQPSGTATTGTATATYVSPQGKNPQGLEIGFSTDRPDIVGLSSTLATCDPSGNASITFQTITPAADTPVKIVANTGGLTAFQQFTVKGSTSGGTTPPPPPGVTINPQSIAFVSASPTTIALKGTGGAGRSETSIVTFLVRGTDGLPLANQTVDFALSTTVGGLTITPTSQVSGATGQVSTIVNAGIISTPVSVTATVRGTAISSQSSQLVVSTGIVAQDGFSISFSNFNPEGLAYDGTTLSVTARLSDHFHNPVPDGTAVSFTTNGGSIQPFCTTSGGACSVVWTSQDPRPAGGKFVILAYAVGEESFVDYNGNGYADTGACGAPFLMQGVGFVRQCGEFIDTPEAFLDINMNGIKNANEPFFDFNGNGSFDGPDGYFNGVLRNPLDPVPAGTPKSKHVFMNTQLVMSGSFANTIDLSPTTVPFNSTVAGTLTVSDVNGNPMPSGTTISLAVNPAASSACLATVPTSFTVLNTSSAGPNSTIFDVSLMNKCIFSTAGPDSITVTVTTPKGNKTTTTFAMSYGP